MIEIISRAENIQFQPGRNRWTHNGDFVFRIYTPYFRGRFASAPGNLCLKKLGQPERMRARLFRRTMKAEFRQGFRGVPRALVDTEYTRLLRRDGVPAWKTVFERGALYILGIVLYQWRYWDRKRAVR